MDIAKVLEKEIHECNPLFIHNEFTNVLYDC